MSVKAYSKKQHGATKLSANFTVKEFACKDGSDKILIDSDLVELLQRIRDRFGKAVVINSAYRNEAYNRKIGGASKSQHINGTAADIRISGVAPEDVAKFAEYLMPNSGGIGLYPAFTHVDVRAKRSRWTDFGTEKSVTGFPGYKPSAKELESINDIVWELHSRGIITDKDLWLKKLTADKDMYWFAYKVCNKTKNK
jgi:hypothetical protein